MAILFIQGLINYQGSRFSDIETTQSQKQREELFINMVEKEICSKILGSYRNKAQWRLSVEKKSSDEKSTLVIGTISMVNYKVRKRIENLYELISNCVPEDNKKVKLCFCLENYNKLMQILRKKWQL